MAVNSAKVKRRKLRFENLDELLDELTRIEQADSLGCLQVIGNWSPGQILSHVAAWIEYGWIGYPIKPPLFIIRWMMKLMLGKYLKSGLPSGVKIPGVKGGTVGQDEVPMTHAIARLRTNIQRLKSGERSKFDSPAFGPLSHEDRITLNLRHAELHLGFMNYDLT